MKIGIIGAMELEVATLKQELTQVVCKNVAGMEFYDGLLDKVPVVVVRCGVGKVNAAMCVQILNDVYQVSHVINTGVAGGLNAGLDIGDILISNAALQHDMNVEPLGYAPGQIPGGDTLSFPADTQMKNDAIACCKNVNPDINVMEGLVVSGDQFIAEQSVREHLIRDFHGDCAEMEGAAIAQAAYLNKLPFVIIRAISDKADHSAQMDYPTFEKQAAKHCAKLVSAFVKSYQAK